MLLSLALYLASGPCPTLAPSGPIRRVQQSEAFARAALALPPSGAPIEMLCSGLKVGESPLPGGAVVVTTLARLEFEPVYAVFAVRGRKVWLLNPIRDGVLAAGLDTAAWHKAVVGHFRIPSDSVARWYARGTFGLISNYGPRPSAFCARDSVVVAQPASDFFVVEDYLLLLRGTIRTDGRILTVAPLACP